MIKFKNKLIAKEQNIQKEATYEMEEHICKTYIWLYICTRIHRELSQLNNKKKKIKESYG